MYVDDLEWLGCRLDVTSDSLVFWTKFYKGLPASDYEWVVASEGA